MVSSRLAEHMRNAEQANGIFDGADGARKQALTCTFAWWAVTGSNRRPLRCKCDPVESRYQGESAFALVTTAFRGVVIVPSIACFCTRPRTIRGLDL